MSSPFTESADDVYERLRQRAAEATPPSWVPEVPGEELFGMLVDVNESAPTKYGSAPVATIRKPDGELASLWLLHAVLRRELERARPMIGEYLLVRFQGKVQPEGGGNSYASYSVVVDRDKRPLDWSAIANRYGDDLDPGILPPSGDVTPPPPADEDIPF